MTAVTTPRRSPATTTTTPTAHAAHVAHVARTASARPAAPASSYSATAAKPLRLPNVTLQRGDHNPQVEVVQKALVKLGAMTSDQMATGPGWFGPRTQGALEKFQQAHHLEPSGVYDRATREAMQAALQPTGTRPQTPVQQPVPTPAPAGVSRGVPHSQAAQYDYFQKFVAQQGGQFDTAPGHVNLVGLRKDNRAGRGDGQYNDVLYAVWKDDAGVKHARRFKYTSEPAQAMRYFSGDSNGDGSNDQGRIPAGHYRFSVGTRSNGDPCLRPVTDFRPERDINHDGRFDEHYRQGDGSVFLFHKGGYYGTGSAGCQTFAPDEWNRFWKTVSGARGSLTYTLTTRIPEGA